MMPLTVRKRLLCHFTLNYVLCHLAAVVWYSGLIVRARGVIEGEVGSGVWMVLCREFFRNIFGSLIALSPLGLIPILDSPHRLLSNLTSHEIIEPQLIAANLALLSLVGFVLLLLRGSRLTIVGLGAAHFLIGYYALAASYLATDSWNQFESMP